MLKQIETLNHSQLTTPQNLEYLAHLWYKQGFFIIFNINSS